MNLFAAIRMKAKLLLAVAAATFVMTVSGVALGDTVNKATVTVPSGFVDTNTGNNTSTDTNTVVPMADLSLTKSISPAVPSAGSLASYTLTVSNTISSGTPTGVTVQDTLPAGFDYWGSTGAGSYDRNTGVWTIGSVAPGASATITINGQILGTAGTTLTNTAQITASSLPDPDSTVNNGVTTEDDFASVSFTIAPVANQPGALAPLTSCPISPMPDVGTIAGWFANSPGDNDTQDGRFTNYSSVSLDYSTVYDPAILAGPGSNMVNGDGIYDYRAGTITYIGGIGGPGTTLSDAIASGDYETMSFTTSATVGNTNTALSAVTVGRQDGLSSFRMSVLVSTSPTFSTYSVLVSDYFYQNSGGAWSPDSIQVTGSPILLQSSTTYYVRIYFYDATYETWAPYEVQFDDFNLRAGSCNVTPVADTGSMPYGTAATPIANVTTNDLIGGQPSVLGASGNATVATSGTWPAGITLDTSTGAVNVAATVLPGTYVVNYQLCDRHAPPTCATTTATVTVTPLSADLVVTKDNGTSSINAGGSTNYTLRVTNTGPSPVTGATLVDAAAAGLTKTAVACSAAASNQCSSAPSIANLEAGTVSLPALASGAFYEVTVTATVTATSGSVSNAATATVPVGTTDPDTTNNTNITDMDTVTPRPVLTLAKSVVNTGGGTAAATDWTLTALRPASGITPALGISGTTGDPAVTSASVEPGTYGLSESGGPSGYQASNYSCVINGGAAVSGNAVTLVHGDTAVCTITNTFLSADLVVTKLDGVTNVPAGGSTTYTVRVTNNGPSSVTGATFVDAAAMGLSKTAVACSGTPGQCVTAPTIAEVESGTFALPTLASGQFYEVTIAANVTATSGTVTNAATATVPSGTTDPTPGDATATDVNTVDPVADLIIVKSNGGTSVTSGTTTTYTMTVTNNGPSTATGAVVTDTVGSNLDCLATNTVSITGDGVPAGTFTVGDLTGAGITLGTLGPGQTATLNFNCNIP